MNNCSNYMHPRQSGRSQCGHNMMQSGMWEQNYPVAMAYVPWQYFKNVYEPEKALQIGTIFPELNKPFYGRGGHC